MIFLPPIETNGRILMLQNYLSLKDTSAGSESALVATTKAGTTIEFINDDADDITGQLIELVALADALQLPIVGIDTEILILPNFALFEDESDDQQNAVCLTDDAGNEYRYTGNAAALILARINHFADQAKQLFEQVQAQNSAGS